MVSLAPLVSVIIPTYNRRDYLRLTLDSVLQQTYPAVEIIVVDDGSTDGTDEMLAEYGGRIQVIRQTNRGGTAARNTGIRAARGAYLTFLDHDDLMLPTKIEQQVQLLEARPEVDACYTRWHYIDGKGCLLDKIGPLPDGDIYKRLVCGCFLWSGAPLVRRQRLERVGEFDESIWSSDWDMWLRLAQSGCRFACIQQPLGAYRILPDSTMADVVHTERLDIRLLDKVYSQNGLPEDIQSVKAQAYATWRFWLSRRYYAVGRGEDGRRNLAEALHLYPALLDDRDGFLETLSNEALDVRVADALAFVGTVFAYLPPAAEAIRSEQNRVLSQVHAGLALRDYAREKLDTAKAYLTEAIQLCPAILDETFRRLCVAYAVRLPVNAEAYIQTVIDHLPPSAASLRAQRSRLLADISMSLAFESYFRGHYHEAISRLVTTLRLRPRWLTNRGVQSVLLKSLFRLAGDRGGIP